MARFVAACLVCALTGFLLFVSGGAARAEEPLKPLTPVELFDGQKLLDVRIEIADDDWKRLSGQALDFVTSFGKGAVASAYTYFPASVTINGRRLEKVELRKKGFFGSSDPIRPSLKVRVLDPDQNKWIAGLDKLTFNNNKQDRSAASQYLGYQLFAAAGLPAPRCSLAVVTVNGKSLGVYSHLESIDQPFLRRTFGDDSGNLYEGVFPTDFLSDRIDRFDAKTNKRANDRSDLRRIAEILRNPGDDVVARLAEQIDLDQFITYWALESLIGFFDGYASNQNNFYLYRSPADSKFHFIPWGADATMAPSFFPNPGGKKSVYAKGQLAFQLNQDAAIRQKYHETLLKLLDTVWREDELIAEVDRIERLITDHLHAAQGGIEQSADATRNFIRNRRAEIMKEIEEGPVHVTTPPAQPFYFREVGKISSKFATRWTPADAKAPVESEETSLEVELEGESVKFSKTIASSGPSKFPNFGGPPGPLPPTIVLSGVREKDGKKLTLTVTVVADQFQGDAAKSVSVQGMLMEGDVPMFGPGMRSFQGKLRLKSAGQDDGDEVEGSLSGKLYQMRGGFGF